jgi:hypothetical protein
MRRTATRARWLTAVAAGLVVLTSTGSAGRAPSTDGVVASNFMVLGHVSLGGKAADGDVVFYEHPPPVGKYAYVGTSGEPCTNRGVKIIDVNDPANPEVVALARNGLRRLSYEDVEVVRIGARDVLVAGLQSCGTTAIGGIGLFDVTQPDAPQLIDVIHVPDGGGVHELDAVARPDGRVLVLATVPYSEDYPDRFSEGDIRIFDITTPESGEEIADWGIIFDSDVKEVRRDRPVKFSEDGLGYYPAYFGHSVRAADLGMTAYVSYWDAGVLELDISNPEEPHLVSQTSYPIEADGDAHSVAVFEHAGRRYLLQNDEDLNALSPAIVTSSSTGGARFQAIDAYRMKTRLSDVGEITAKAVLATGKLCDKSDFPRARGMILVARMSIGTCGGNKVLRYAAARGAAAVLIVWRGFDPGWWMYELAPRGASDDIARDAPRMAAVVTAGRDGLSHALRADIESGEDVEVTLSPRQPSWGYLRVFAADGATDENGDGVVDLEQVGSFDDLPNVVGNPDPPPGWWSIHNTEVLGDRAYSSWYSNGVVALDMSEPSAPTEVGHFVPPATRRRAEALSYLTGRGKFPLVWGVDVDPLTGALYVSDMRSGLWIVEPTGPARAFP